MVRVTIIAGGATLEREVSLRSANRVRAALKSRGHQVRVVDLDSQVLNNLTETAPDVVWPLVHGSVGEDGSLQDLLAMAGYKFVGTPAAGCRLAASKPVAKSVVDKNGLPTPSAVALPKQLFKLLGARQILSHVKDSVGLPVVVKPAYGGSGFGISFVDDFADLPEAMANAFAYCDVVLVEQKIKGQVVTVSILEREDEVTAFPPIEIEVESGKYDYDARYFAGDARFHTPARISDDAIAAAKQLALDCHRVLELEQFSRIDMVIDKDQNPWFIDASPVPGMTDTSLFPLATENGPGFAVVCEALITDALTR